LVACGWSNHFCLVFFSSYLIQQQKERVLTGASISAKGLASVIDERLAQQSLMVKALAFHNSERIKMLAQGQGNASDLVELMGYVGGVFPNAIKFAVLDALGKTVVGKEQVNIAKACQTDIQRHLISPSPQVSFLGPHNSPDGGIHYDLSYPLGNNEGEGKYELVLFLSFKLDMYQALIEHFDTDVFEFVLVKASPPHNVIASARGVAESAYGSVLDKETLNSRLLQFSVLNGHWVLWVYRKGRCFRIIRTVFTWLRPFF